MARRRNVRVDDFDATLQGILLEYGQHVTAATRQAVLEAAKVAKQETQAAAPVGKRGRYQRGWAVKEESISRLGTEAIVHNRTDYQLAHLLEKGHALRGGGRSPAISHIKPAEEHAIKNLEEAMEEIAKRQNS